MASWVLVLLLLFPLTAPAQRGPGLMTREQQRDAILKADHEKSLKDIAELRELAREVEEELEKNEEHVIDVRTLRKVERMEELAKDIQKRMRRMF